MSKKVKKMKKRKIFIINVIFVTLVVYRYIQKKEIKKIVINCNYREKIFLSHNFRARA